MSNVSVNEVTPTSPLPTLLTAPAIAPSGHELRQLVSSPDTLCDLETFAHALTVRDIIFECEGDGPLAQHPGFPGAVRQAIGSELIATASREALAGLPCPWSPACGLQVFFNGEQGTKVGETAPPWIIRSESVDASTVRITLRLFGLGLLWTNNLADACHRAIERGIYIGGMGPVCDSVLIRSIEGVWTGLRDEPELADTAIVAFVTPLAWNDDQYDVPFDEHFFHGLLYRVIDIARWHGMQIEEAETHLKSLAAGCSVREEGLSEMKWNRSISQQRSASIAMQGKTGLMRIALPKDGRKSLSRLLTIGALLNSGGMTAFGQGRYNLFFLD
ncbi:hypothetical protein [uncultured Cohaesibacter sp.]|uniref:hypothetical protein n=1 Tax=uncultured Cohaesibacter sp. TaxID=1002546 RepID=UPI00293017D5|nr:hypothetical protein [uncultured Cohaesibacter sp.]